MDLIKWIKKLLILKQVENILIMSQHHPLHFHPKTFNSLVVNGEASDEASTIDTPLGAIQHVTNYHNIFCPQNPHALWRVDCLCFVVYAASEVGNNDGFANAQINKISKDDGCHA